MDTLQDQRLRLLEVHLLPRLLYRMLPRPRPLPLCLPSVQSVVHKLQLQHLRTFVSIP